MWIENVLPALAGDGLKKGTITGLPPMAPGASPNPANLTTWFAWTQSIPAGTKVAYGTVINFEFYDAASFPDPTCTP
jgi:hypothetical protein